MLILSYEITLKSLERIPGPTELTVSGHAHICPRCNQCGLWFDPLCCNDLARASLGGQLCCSASHHLPFITRCLSLSSSHQPAADRFLTRVHRHTCPIWHKMLHRWRTGHTECFFFVVFWGIYLCGCAASQKKSLLGIFALNLQKV